MGRAARRGASLVLAVTLLVLSCTAPEVAPSEARADGGPIEVAAPARLPAGQDLYRPPTELVDGPAGSLIWYETTFPPVEGAAAWRVLYRSRSDDGRPTVVSGLVVRPGGPAPAGGFPVVSWAIGTPGLADRCAPTKGAPVIPRLRRLLRQGFVVVATDGEGLGTPGPSHYLVGESEAHGLLDIARAARGLPGLGAGSRVLLWGYSSGGHGVIRAAERAPEYAPDVELLGTAAVAPVVDVGRFIGSVDQNPGFALITVGAWVRVHGLDPAGVFTDRALTQVPRLSRECSLTLSLDFAGWRRQDLVRVDLRTSEPWRSWFAAERVGTAPVDGPLLVLHGTADSIVAPAPTGALVRRQCRAGAVVDHRPLVGDDHFVAFTTASEVVDWLVARTRGEPATDTCP